MSHAGIVNRVVAIVVFALMFVGQLHAAIGESETGNPESYACSAGSNTGTSSSSGSAVLLFSGVATGYDFKTVPIGESRSVNFEFKNQALTNYIRIDSIEAAGPGFYFVDHNCPRYVAAGQSCGGVVVFSPRVYTPLSTCGGNDHFGEFRLYSNLIGSPERRSLVGTSAEGNSPALPPPPPAPPITGFGDDWYCGGCFPPPPD